MSVIMLGEPLYTYIVSLEPSPIPKCGNVHVLFDLDEILNVYFSISRSPTSHRFNFSLHILFFNSFKMLLCVYG